ncbi:MAG: hypothetical protein JW951_00580, partial [Lentisphaerae bacterium]|nr:hypothetical protein [Lentisphaerota bacterium]
MKRRHAFFERKAPVGAGLAGDRRAGTGPGRRVVIALLVTLFVWLVFTWPLPRFVATGIPSSDRNVEKYHRREMISGDHLQLLYHFWLAADMLRGETPVFYNLYEFNTGNDAERYRPEPYYMPFSLLYAAAAPLGGQAFGWNAAGWVALFLTFWLTWLLVRRYVRREGPALLGAVLGFMLPYRWITLLTGSPTGFGMALVPALFLGLDRAVRDGKPGGGLLAGVALLCAYGSDLHTFYFAALAAPGWCVLAWLAGRRDAAAGDEAMPCCGRLAAALAPAAAGGAAAAWLGELAQGGFAGTDMEGGRSLDAVARFSPEPAGLVSWANLGVSNHVFFGTALAL